MIRGRERMIQPHLCTPDSVGLDTSSGVDKFLPAKAEFGINCVPYPPLVVAGLIRNCSQALAFILRTKGLEYLILLLDCGQYCKQWKSTNLVGLNLAWSLFLQPCHQLHTELRLSNTP